MPARIELPKGTRLSKEVKTEIVKAYLEKDLNGRPVNSAADLAKVYGVSWHAIRLILDKAGLPRRSRSEAATLVCKRPEVKERHRLAGHAIWEDSEKRQRMIKGMNRPEVKERQRAAKIAAHSRPETAQRHRDVALAMWTERKEKLAAAERILAQQAHQQPTGRIGGRPRNDANRDKVRQLRQSGKSWAQVQTYMNAKTGQKLTVGAYRNLLGR
jgi:hypothetical protein